MRQETLLPTEPFSVNEFIQWRANHLEQLNRDITSLEEDGISLDQTFEDIAISVQLDSRSNSLLGNFRTEQDVARATTLNLLSTYGHSRNSGRNYATHPELVGNSIAYIATDMPTVLLRECKIISSVHDVIEEGPMRAEHKGIDLVHPVISMQKGFSDVQIIQSSKSRLDSLFPLRNLGKNVVELMEPIIPEEEYERYQKLGYDKNLVEYAHFGRMLQQSVNPIVGMVELGDRIDDLCDLDYIFNKPVSAEAKGKMLAGKLARCEHTFHSVITSPVASELSQKLIGAFRDVYAKVVTDNASVIDMNYLNNRIDAYHQFCVQNQAQIDEVLYEYGRAVCE